MKDLVFWVCLGITAAAAIPLVLLNKREKMGTVSWILLLIVAVSSLAGSFSTL